MEMFFEEYRLKTFRNWPYDDDLSCNAAKVAEAGFYFVGDKYSPDLVKCFLCDKTLENWEEDDDPMEEHKSHANYCEFAKLGRSEMNLTVKEMLKMKRLFFMKFFQDQIDSYENILKRIEGLKVNKKQRRLKVKK